MLIASISEAPTDRSDRHPFATSYHRVRVPWNRRRHTATAFYTLLIGTASDPPTTPNICRRNAAPGRPGARTRPSSPLQDRPSSLVFETNFPNHQQASRFRHGPRTICRERRSPIQQVCRCKGKLFLRDCTNGTQVIPRVSRWSEAGDDIRALRRLVKDGPFTVAETSRPLLAASLSVAMVRNDDQGNTRLTKKASNNTSRDDVAAALVLGAGVFQRARAQPKRTGAYLGTA